MKAIILVRVSTKQQHLDKQRDELVAMAKYDGFNEENIIVIENKESAIKIKDESESLGLTQMFKLIESDSSIKCVYAYELSRIGRKQIVNEKVKDFLVEHKVNLKIKEPSFSLLDKDGNLNNATELVFSLFNTMAAQEMRLKKVRLQRGKEEAKERGEIGNGDCLYGYYVGKDKKIYIDEEKAKVVRYIFNAYNDGMIPNKIFKECYERGWLTKKKNSRSENASIRGFLAEKKYMGEVTESGVVRYPQIISSELWHSVETLRSENKSNKKNIKNCYIGSGLIWHKGHALCGRNKNQYITLDNSFSIRCNVIDFVLWETAKDIQTMTDTKGFEEKEEELLAMQESLTQKMEANKKYTKELEEKQEKIEEVYIISHKSKEWLQAQISNIENERKAFKAQYLSLYNEFENVRNALFRNLIGEQMNYSAEEMDTVFNTPEKKKEFINRHIKRVILEQGEEYRTIWIESKRFGTLSYYYEYKSQGHKITMYKVDKDNNKEYVNYKRGC